jgi:RNA polymerase sigma-70 factor (ECF subfamily)
MSDADDRDLVEAAKRDTSKFADLYDRHFERTYAFIAGRVRSRDAAEELTAEVFHKALAALPGFEWRGAPFGAWLIRIAANAVADRAARVFRERGEPAAVEAVSAQPAADVEIQRAEERARLFRFVDELPVDQRTVIVERFVHERSIRETAALIGRSEGAVKQLQLRGMHELRARMMGVLGAAVPGDDNDA